ncbi:MAG: anaerobic ribonucleoside-triphosphate reductase activating protein [Pelistega sp.]|nr:anaerobic ribonucleoside-triphosphate reductase activating protein [Pelistega sp.]
MNKFRYSHEQVVWLEVPNEVSLAYQISGCPLRCKGCHSADTWKLGVGQELSREYLNSRLKQYQGLISCVLFLGGEWQVDELIARLQQVKQGGLKTCLYTGFEQVELAEEIIPHLDYLKTGRWMAELGGLDSPTTNQRFVQLSTGADLTHLFRKGN